jgi:hypothetical protein
MSVRGASSLSSTVLVALKCTETDIMWQENDHNTRICGLITPHQLMRKYNVYWTQTHTRTGQPGYGLETWVRILTAACDSSLLVNAQTVSEAHPEANAIDTGFFPVGRDSSVGIAIRYGLDGPGIETRWKRPALRPTQPPIQWVPGLSRG